MVSDKLIIMSLYIESTSDKRIRQTASATVLLLAVSSGVLSYNALRELAVMAGIHPVLAFLFPITLDGLILAGSLLILYFAVRGKRSAYGLFLTALGVIASIAGNVVISPDNLTYQILHATSPVVLFLSLESLMILLRARSRNAQEAEEALKKADKEAVATNAIPVIDTTAVEKPQEPVASPVSIPEQDLPAEVETEPVVAPQPVVPVVFSTPEPLIADVVEATADTVPQPVKAQEEAPVKVPAKAKSVVPAKPKTPAPVTAKTVSDADADNQPSKREVIRELLTKDPEMDANDIVDLVGGDRKYVRKLIRAERDKILSA